MATGTVMPDFPADSTMAKLVQDDSIQQLLNIQRGILLNSGTKEAVLCSGDKTVIDLYYHKLAAEVTSADEMNALLVEWWQYQWADADGDTDSAKRKSLLARWFGTVLEDQRVHGVKFPQFSTSHTAIGELLGDSAGKTCTPSTASTAGSDPFAHLAQFYCLEVAWEKNTDGTHEIYAVEYIDDYPAVRSSGHLCGVMQKNTWIADYLSSGYRYTWSRCHPAVGYQQWPQGTDAADNTYPYIINPKYPAGLNEDGSVTCETGKAPTNYMSHNDNVALWKERGEQYSGASGCLLKWQYIMMALKYGIKGNGTDGPIAGCVSYDYQYTAAVSEEGVERIILTTAQAANLHEGSNIILGDMGTGTSKDRGTASMYSICKNKRISTIESVTIDDTTYAAVNIDNGGETFDTVAGTTYISTMPYWSGWNDDVLGYDGSRYSYTNGHEPGLIQKTEFQTGLYLIISDELWQWGADDDGNYTFDCYTCHDQSKVTTNGSISSDYTKQEDLTLTFAADCDNNCWYYIEDIAVSDDFAVLWPASVSKSAGSGTGCKAGFYVYAVSSGTRAAWRCCPLSDYGSAGLPARDSGYGPGDRNWLGGGGSPGL